MPSCHPFKNIIATIETMTIDTQNMDNMLYMTFLVATRSTIEAKVIAMIIPWIADVTNAISRIISCQDFDD